MNTFKEFKGDSMEREEINELIKLLEDNNLKKIRVRNGNFEVEIEKDRHPAPPHHYPKHLSSHHEEHPKHEAKKETYSDESYIKSPMVGTFYSSPAPDKPAFVKVGDRVTKDSVICIIEAMKVMNEVKANAEGTVAEILVDNASPVEFGTKLIRIE